MIMFIRLNTSLCILYVKVKLLQLLHYHLINWYTMISYNDPAIERNIINLLAPLMLKNLLYSISLRRIDVQYFL